MPLSSIRKCQLSDVSKERIEETDDFLEICSNSRNIAAAAVVLLAERFMRYKSAHGNSVSGMNSPTGGMMTPMGLALQFFQLVLL